MIGRMRNKTPEVIGYPIGFTSLPADVDGRCTERITSQSKAEGVKSIHTAFPNKCRDSSSSEYASLAYFYKNFSLQAYQGRRF